MSFSGFGRRSSVLGDFLRKSKFSRSLNKKGSFSTKRAPFYKGVGCRSLGRHTKKGRFIIVPAKVPVYIMPDLTDCKLKPYVAHTTPKVKINPPRLPSKQEMEAARTKWAELQAERSAKDLSIENNQTAHGQEQKEAA